MSTGSYLQVYVKCPFYRRDDGKHNITCEGIFNDGNCTQFFKSREDFETQMKVFCWEKFENCEWYRALMAAKYDDYEC